MESRTKEAIKKPQPQRLKPGDGDTRNIPAFHSQSRPQDTTSGGWRSLAKAFDTTDQQLVTREGQCEPKQEQQVPRRIVNNARTLSAAAKNDTPISC